MDVECANNRNCAFSEIHPSEPQLEQDAGQTTIQDRFSFAILFLPHMLQILNFVIGIPSSPAPLTA